MATSNYTATSTTLTDVTGHVAGAAHVIAPERHWCNPGSMARFFFDIHDGAATVSDPDGLELPDMNAACVEAVKALPDLAKDALPDGKEKKFVVWVRDEGGACLLAATLTLKVEKL